MKYATNEENIPPQRPPRSKKKIIKIKRENQILTQKVHMSEERIRGLELQSQSQERLMKEQKRNKDLLQRLEHEKTLETENYAMRSAPQIMMLLV